MAVLTKSGLVIEALRRQVRKNDIKPIELDPNFPQQNNFILDPAQFISAQCSRRAGKTSGLAHKYHNAMQTHPDGTCVYLGLTSASAKGAIWPAFKKFEERHKIGYQFKTGTNEIVHPNGAVLRIVGADTENFKDRLRGFGSPGIGIDEAQSFGSHLESLVDDILTPLMADYSDSWLAVTGTPGPVPMGFFFDITCNGKYDFSLHKWTLYENPNMPNPQEFVAKLIKRKKWDSTNPTLLREWLNQWVLDLDALWVRYQANLNHYDLLPSGHQWNYVMGVDIGFKDADALAVLAWSKTSPDTYLVHEEIQAKQTISDLIEAIDRLQKQYSIYKIVLDEGGLGKKIGEEIRRRFACPLEPADKANKQDNVEFLNDHLRLGRFKAKSDSQFAKDSYMVQIDWEKSTPKRVALKKGFHSDIIDAVLYAFRESYAFTHTPEIAPPKPGSRAWAEAEEEKMFEAEVKSLQEEQDYLEFLKNDGYNS